MPKTHWKKIVSDPHYLGEADFNEGEEKVATIASVSNAETITTTEGKSEKVVLHFAEPLKPMILNVTNAKAVSKVADSPFVEDWTGVRIQLYIEHNIKAFGEIVSAVRVRPRKPREAPPILCADCGGPIKPANGRSAEYMANYTQKKFKVSVCYDCAMKRMTASKREEDADVTPSPAKEAPAD